MAFSVSFVFFSLEIKGRNKSANSLYNNSPNEGKTGDLPAERNPVVSKTPTVPCRDQVDQLIVKVPQIFNQDSGNGSESQKTS
jgi:hypothetical protein